MKLPDIDLNKAFTVFEEWGPKRRIDRSVRLKEEFPSLSSQEVDLLIKEMKKLSATIWKIAEMGGESRIGKNRIVKLIQEAHPYIKGEGLNHAMTLINYYAWHEGYDK